MICEHGRLIQGIVKRSHEHMEDWLWLFLAYAIWNLPYFMYQVAKMVVNVGSLKFEHDINWRYLCYCLFIILTGSLAHEIYESFKKKSEALKCLTTKKELEVKKEKNEKERNKSFKQLV